MINVVISILKYNDKFLLVKRKKGNFPNHWGLIGGKVEENEHLDEAIVRELFEETELSVEPVELLGVSTEYVKSDDSSSFTILYCWLVSLKSADFAHIDTHDSWISKSEKLELRWFTLDELNSRDDIIGSDLEFVNHFYVSKDTNYLRVDCIKYSNGKYSWNLV